PEFIQYDADRLFKIDQTIKSIFRIIIFNRNHKQFDLLDRYLEAVEHLRDVLSIKNAQQEAQSVEEAAEYLEGLKEGLSMIVDEVADQKTLEQPLDLFYLIRTIAPDAAARNPNHYRQTEVQFGPCSGASPHEIPGLVEQLFHVLPSIPHPVIRAIYLHHELVRIHPFVDGNGRLSRMAKNWVLMFELYPPMFIGDFADKTNYIEKLQESFLAIEATPNQSHPATASFFEDELKRLKASAGFILERMKKNPNLTFDTLTTGGADA
ncbi:MAG: Fic family protein, partial [Verrucomicrobiota bacterium]